MDMQRIKNKFFEADLAGTTWWGDHVDVRFHLLENIEKNESKNILEIGCGSGIILSEINCFKVGVDTSLNSLIYAKKSSGAILIQADANFLPIKKRFDTIIVANLIEMLYINSKERVLKIQEFFKKISELLNKSGKVYLTTPNNARYQSTKLSYSELSEMLSIFSSVKIHGWNPFPNYPKFIPSRVLCRIPGWFNLIEFLMNHDVGLKRCKAFYVVAEK